MITAVHNNKKYNIDFADSENSSGTINKQDFLLDIVKKNNNSYHILFENNSYNINILSVDTEKKQVSLKINQKVFSVKLTEEIDLLLNKMGIKNKSEKVKKELKAPMPGLIVDIPVKEGDEINKGETLLVLEAMKMENNLKAEHDIIIKSILAQKGTSVEKNEILIVFN
jgi:acetyl/propionyl-CoA carboxylase alpha subunit